MSVSHHSDKDTAHTARATAPDCTATTTTPQPGQTNTATHGAPALGNRETTLTREENPRSKQPIVEAMKPLWRYSERKSHRECHRVPSGVEVGVTTEGGTVGLRNSRSRLSPMAAKALYREESLDLQAMVLAFLPNNRMAMRARRRVEGRAWLKAAAQVPVEVVRRDVGMATFTLRHAVGDGLAELLELLQAGWNYVNTSRKFRQLCERYGVVCWWWGLETSHGFKNGHHPHRHMLLFFKRRLSDSEAEALEGELFELWREGVVRAGGRAPSREHGLDLRMASRDGARGLAEYVTKGLALEVSGGLIKSGRAGNRSPHEVLLSLAEEPNPRDVAVWHEMETALRGVRWQGQSRNLREVMDANGFDAVRAELEAELEASDGVPRTVLVALSRASWREVATDVEARAEILNAAKTGETVVERLESVERVLARRGLSWRRVMVPVEEYELVVPSAACSVPWSRAAWQVVPMVRSAELVPA